MRHDLRARVSGAVGALGACSRHIVYRAAAALIVLVVLLVGGVLWGYWSSLYRDVQARSGTLAFLLAEQTTRTFQAVDLTLAGLEPVLDTVPAWPDHAAAIEKLLAQRVSELDFLHAIYVVDAEGQVTESSGDATATVAGAAVEPYFDEFRRHPDIRILVGQPVFARPGQLSAIPVMRRLSTPAGDFDGMVVASVEPRYFSDFYRNVDLGRRGTIDLYQDNGSILLASTSDVPALPLTATPSFDLALPLGNFRTSGRIADQRLIAFHRAAPYPLVVAVGFDLNELWRRWWHIAAPSMAATLAIAILVWALAVTVVRRLAERRRAQSRAVMVQKLEALGQMTASVSHDFRNLLAVMTSTLSLVRRRGPDETVLRAAEEALERGDKLITQLLAFSKRHELQLRPASINALLDGLDGVLRHAAGRDVSLVFEKAEALPLCRADQTQFDAALLNLVVNARQAMPRGGRVTIATRPARAGGVELTVADTGVGIAPGDLKRVFEPFFTTKADAGTGLGLAQVYGFMRRIGGDVAVASRPGAGTTVTLLFPLAEGRPQAEAARPAA